MLRRTRLSLLAAIALAAGLLAPVAPAHADTPVVEPTPAVEPVETPTPHVETPTAPDSTKPPTAAALSFGTLAVVTPTKSSASPPVLTTGLTATPALPSGTSVAYSWTQLGTVVGTGKTYTPTAAVTGDLVVRVVVSRAGYDTQTMYSTPFADYYLVAMSSPLLTGTPALGQSLTCTTPELRNRDDTTVVTTPTFTWYRGATKITGATSSSYTVTAADVGAVLECRQVAKVPGYVPLQLSVATALPIPAATFGGSHTASIGGPTASVLRADTTHTIVDPLPALGAPVTTYQWLRDGVAISGATKQTYTLTAADNGRVTGVRIVISKPGFSSVTITPTVSATLRPSAAPYIQGSIVAGAHLQVVLPTWTLGSTSVSPIVAIQWLRDGVAIPGAAARLAAYDLQPADTGHTIAVRVTATYPDRPAFVMTTPASQKIGVSAFTGLDTPVTIMSCCMNGRLEVNGTGLTPTGTNSYQWLRNGLPIAGATKVSYLLTAADRGTLTSVLVRTTHPGYTPVVKLSFAQDYSINASGPPVLAPVVPDRFRVGDTLMVHLPSYWLPGGGTSATPTYQWLRNGAVISGATAASYAIRSGDLGARISVRVTGSASGFNAVVGTSSQTPVVTKGALAVNTLAQTTLTNSLGVLSAGVPSGAILTPEVTLSYQWYRQTGAAAPVPVTGATKQTYKLSSADTDKKVSVRITVSKANVVPTSASLAMSPASDFSILNSVPSSVSGTNKVGQTLTFVPGQFTNAYGSVFVPGIALQWYRSGVAIKSATGTTYVLTAADLNKAITVRATASTAILISRTFTSSPVPAVTGLGAIDLGSGATPTITNGTGVGQIQAAMPSGSILTPGTTTAWQWFREDAPIKGATSAVFTMASTDSATRFSVRATITKAGYQTRQVAPAGYVVRGVHTTTAFGGLGMTQVGRGIFVNSPTWVYDVGGATVDPIRKYQWYRNGKSIAGANGTTYMFVAADFGAIVSVRESVSGPGIVPNSVLRVFDCEGCRITHGVNTEDGTAIVTLTPATNTLTASIEAGSLDPATPAPVLSYQWYRKSNGVATKITGATKATYKLNDGADYQKSIFVKITVKRDKFVTDDANYELESAGRNYTSLPGPQVTFPLAPKFSIPFLAPTPTWRDANGDMITTNPSSTTYQWMRTSNPTGEGLRAIPGATKATYTPTAADIGMYLTVTYSATIPGYLRPPHPSAALSQAVQPLSLGWNGTYPTITQTENTLVLTAKPPVGAFTVAPTSYTYQWTRRQQDGAAAAIPGATKSTYTVTAADYRHFISVRVTAVKPGYASVPMNASEITRSITATAAPTLSPNTGIHVGTVVQATNPTLTPAVAGITYRYQWYRWNGAVGLPISGATQPSYTAKAADVGKELYVIVGWKRTGWLTADLGSIYTAPVAP